MDFGAFARDGTGAGAMVDVRLIPITDVFHLLLHCPLLVCKLGIWHTMIERCALSLLGNRKGSCTPSGGAVPQVAGVLDRVRDAAHPPSSQPASLPQAGGGGGTVL